MPTPRKPLIAPGSILPAGGDAAEGGPGLLERIVRKDGARHGRLPENLEESTPVSDSESDAPSVANATNANTTKNITSNTVSQSYDNTAGRQEYRTDDRSSDKSTDRLDDKHIDQLIARSDSRPVRTSISRPENRSSTPSPSLSASPSGSQSVGQAADTSDARTAISMIGHLARSVAVAVTLKAPIELSQYLDDYVHSRHREKIRKQDLIKRGLMLAIYELETGEELVRFDG